MELTLIPAPGDDGRVTYAFAAVEELDASRGELQR